MRGNCRDCKTIEENIYWKRFRCVQFSQILSGHFEKQLEVPNKFAMNLRKKLGEVVSLKVPSGAIWEVGLETEEDSLVFKRGWKRFIKDNDLKENDIVIFKFNGSLVFDVMFFDGKSLCEKEGSYFVRKCDHPDMDKEKRMGEKHIAEETSEEVPGGGGRQSPEDKGDVGQVEESFEAGNAPEDDNVLDWTLSKKSRKDDAETPRSFTRRGTTKRLIRRRKMNSTAEVRKTPLEYYSNRRPVTEEEKAYAEQRANADTSIESLVIVMKEYNINRRFFLTLPSWWSNEHLPKRSVIIKLQLEGKIWPIKFDKRSSGGMITCGWKNFALDNFLEEGDVCLFNIISEKSNPIVMEVKIFRVVEEVVPPTPLCPPSSNHRGRGRGRKLY